MPNKLFPLSKGHNYRLGSGWRWSVYELEDGSNRYRLLVAYEHRKAQYLAWLGLCDGNDQALIGRLEYHPDHRGWHCHYKRGLLASVQRGVVKEAGPREACRLCPTGKPFSISDADGVGVAFRIFGVSFDGGGAELFQ